MKKLCFVLVAAILLSGCAVTRDGVKFGSTPTGSKKEIEEFRKQATKSGLKAIYEETGNKDIVKLDKVGVVIVGTLGPYRELDESDKKKMYKHYLKYVENFGSDKKAHLSESEYISKFSGWASVETWSIPGVLWRRGNFMVPSGIKDSLEFSSTIGSSLVGATGDLVGCRYGADGIGYIDKLLCKEDDDECYKSYGRGVYEVNSGRELSPSNFDLLSNKVKIDPITYKLISK